MDKKVLSGKALSMYLDFFYNSSYGNNYPL